MRDAKVFPALWVVVWATGCGGSQSSDAASFGQFDPTVLGGEQGAGAANARESISGLWRFESATCGGEPVDIKAPAFEEDLEVSVAWPAYSVIAHTFVRSEDNKLCRYRVDRRIEPGGSPQRVVETGRWPDPQDCPGTPEPPLHGELRQDGEALVFTMQGPSFCPGKPWVFRYQRVQCGSGAPAPQAAATGHPALRCDG